MIVPYVIFIRPIPVLGTYIRQDQFRADEGWTIDVHDYGVTLSKAAGQNVPAVEAFCTCGVGYSIPSPPAALEEETVRALAGEGISEETLGNVEMKAEALLAKGAAAAKGRRK